jgi:hypothetical protein
VNAFGLRTQQRNRQLSIPIPRNVNSDPMQQRADGVDGRIFPRIDVTSAAREAGLTASANEVVIRQYSSTAKSVTAKQNREKVCSGAIGLFVVTIGPFGFSFQLGYLPAHLRDLPLQSFLGHKERTEQVPTQIEKVRKRLE